jgi:hypothetical protein
MTFVSWAAYYEGDSDAAYFDVLIPRVMEEIVTTRGTRHADIAAAPAVRLRRGTVDAVAREACAAQEAFHLIFIHGDTGGRGLEVGVDQRVRAYCEAMFVRCDWPPVRCIMISPRPETEAWILADPQAVAEALGYVGPPSDIGLPVTARAAEQLRDPKAVLQAAVQAVRRRRRPYYAKQIFPAIAQCHSLANLRRLESFAAFETRLQASLADLGVCERT